MKNTKTILEDFESFGPEALTWNGTQEVAKLFLRALSDTPVGQTIRQSGLWTPSNLQLIADRAEAENGEFTFADFVRTADKLERLGKLEAEPEPVVEAAPEVERDSLGRPLSSKALKWKRWLEWCSNPATKSEDIQTLRRMEPEFAEFYTAMSAKERSGGVGDAVTPVGAPEKKARVSEDLLLFVKRYNATPVDRLKPRGGFVDLAGTLMPWPEFQELQVRATNARLI